jgi:MgtC family
MTVGDLAYRDLGVALAAGLLIGIERGWRQRDIGEGGRVAGVRTFALLGGLGGMVGLVARQYGIVVPAILLGGAVIMLIIGYARSMAGPEDVSVTSVVAALLTLCLGILATSGQPALAMAAAAIITMILSLRSGLHGLIQKLGEADVIALARFSIIAGAIWSLRCVEPAAAVVGSRIRDWAILCQLRRQPYIRRRKRHIGHCGHWWSLFFHSSYRIVVTPAAK